MKKTTPANTQSLNAQPPDAQPPEQQASPVYFSRRERQIMDVVYKRSRASVADVLEDLPDPPSYSAVRTLLRILEDKGHLQHSRVGQRYVFSPTVKTDTARRSALWHLVQTFFNGSAELTVAALLDTSKLSDAQFDRLADMIEQARQDGR